ncbi:MAG: M48 family metalloprotease [Candidatus Moduliflexus flocculans]|nr:M48 family metalloprotease [Candidatus Moduliflexus flocculans]
MTCNTGSRTRSSSSRRNDRRTAMTPEEPGRPAPLPWPRRSPAPSIPSPARRSSCSTPRPRRSSWASRPTRRSRPSTASTTTPRCRATSAKLGLGLAAKSQRPGLPWRFTVLDSPVVNAFAVPGGSIYVTRGILAMMSSEAELAAVLGHEIGHVTARHSMSQMSKQQVAQIGLVAGSVISRKFAQYAGLASAGPAGPLPRSTAGTTRTRPTPSASTIPGPTGYNPADMAVTFQAPPEDGRPVGGQLLARLPLDPPPDGRPDHERPGHAQARGRGPGPPARGLSSHGRERRSTARTPRQGYVENARLLPSRPPLPVRRPGGLDGPELPGQRDPDRGRPERPASSCGAGKFDRHARGVRPQGGRGDHPVGRQAHRREPDARSTVWPATSRPTRSPRRDQSTIRMSLSCLKKGDLVYAFQAMSPAGRLPANTRRASRPWSARSGT